MSYQCTRTIIHGECFAHCCGMIAASTLGELCMHSATVCTSPYSCTAYCGTLLVQPLVQYAARNICQSPRPQYQQLPSCRKAAAARGCWRAPPICIAAWRAPIMPSMPPKPAPGAAAVVAAVVASKALAWGWERGAEMIKQSVGRYAGEASG